MLATKLCCTRTSTKIDDDRRRHESVDHVLGDSIFGERDGDGVLVRHGLRDRKPVREAARRTGRRLRGRDVARQPIRPRSGVRAQKQARLHLLVRHGLRHRAVLRQGVRLHRRGLHGPLTVDLAPLPGVQYPRSRKIGSRADIPEARRTTRHQGRFFLPSMVGCARNPHGWPALARYVNLAQFRHHLPDISVGGLHV